MSDKFIYFDNASTTFTAAEVISSIEHAFQMKLGSPSAHIHSAGIRAGKMLEAARENVANLIAAAPKSVIFTSGATESNNIAISGLLKANDDYQLAVSSIEHFSILNQAIQLKSSGHRVSLIDTDKFGVVNFDTLGNTLRAGKTLVSVALANPEIGAIQPIERIGGLCRKFGAKLHCDAAAGAHILPIDVARMSIDMLTLSGHSMHAPPGVGALYVRDGVHLQSLFEGGNQEYGIRPGSENIVGAIGMGRACALAVENRDNWNAHLTRLGLRLWDGIWRNVKFVHQTGPSQERLAGHVSFWVEHVEGESLLLLLNMNGVMAASGSACSSNLKGLSEEDLAPSHVLTAVGVPTDICAGSLTMSLAYYNTEAEVDYVVGILPGIIEKLLAMSPSYSDYMKTKERPHG
jgi:cysteine desulfurase